MYKLLDELTHDEFFLLVKVKLDGHELPNALPDHLIPPSKRHLVNNNNNNGGGAYGNPTMYPTLGNNYSSGYN